MALSEEKQILRTMVTCTVGEMSELVDKAITKAIKEFESRMELQFKHYVDRDRCVSNRDVVNEKNDAKFENLRKAIDTVSSNVQSLSNLLTHATNENDFKRSNVIEQVDGIGQRIDKIEHGIQEISLRLKVLEDLKTKASGIQWLLGGGGISIGVGIITIVGYLINSKISVP